ncbi:hypothetical protein [Niallia circulans]|uniref:hypothetical protein n=1 Tax=Niallia circulans TaxID=1397 RepID=UPI00352EC5A7
MTNEQNEKLLSLTLTNGTIDTIEKGYEKLKIRGSVKVLQDVQVKEISTHGHSLFQSQVISEILRNTGSCILNGDNKVEKITNSGILKINKGEIEELTSSGSLTIMDIIHVTHMNVIGIVQGKEIHSAIFNLKLAGTNKINLLIANDICVERAKMNLTLANKKLICQQIKGDTILLSHTIANSVEGNVVTIKKNCEIQKLYYKDHYTISPLATVHQIIRSEES